MTERDFFYWLQGYFELSATLEPLDQTTAECISRHIDLVQASGEATFRLGAVAGLVRLIVSAAQANEPPMASATARVRSIVSDYFEHVVDPEAGGPKEQAKLNALHHAVRPGGTARC